jgi:hypothetical protein
MAVVAVLIVVARRRRRTVPDPQRGLDGATTT